MTEPVELRVYRFKPDGLDPITVYIEQYSERESRMTVQCYAQAWTCFWGSHSDGPVEDFVCFSGDEYVASNLIWGDRGHLRKDAEKRQKQYLVKIAAAIRRHFESLRAPVAKENANA